jgi:uncharacterized membrane protein SpoIIM required for sporulation
VVSTAWIARRRPYWRRLEGLLEVSTRIGLKGLGADDLRELALLYRQVASDLASVADDPASAQLAHDLNHMLARAHNTIYAAAPPAGRGLVGFLVDTFPRALHRNRGACLIAGAIFVLGGLLGTALTVGDPDFALKVLGPEMIATIGRHEMWTHSIVAIKPLASSAIMTNNITVSFLAFAAGITAGLGTVYLMAFNGLLLGVVAAACAGAGMSVPFWSFVAPHGALELPALVIAGGAGLRLGQGLLFPGYLPRRQALIGASREAVPLILGCIPLLIVAGILEAFVSPSGLSVPLKLGVSATLVTLLVIYVGRPLGPAVTDDPLL